MVMMYIVKLICLLVITMQIEARCTYNTRCTRARDTIIQSGISVPKIEKFFNLGRWWIIQPTGSNSNVLMAFKNFQSTANTVVIRTIKRNGEQVVNVLGGTLKNFEILERNVWMITVNVSITQETSTDFTLEYYSDCEVTEETYVKYHGYYQNKQYPSKCVIIMPNAQGQVNRIYFIMKNVTLPYGVQLKIKDIHSSEIIGTLEGAVSYKVLAAQSSATSGGFNSYFTMLDLTCTSKSCDYTQAQYLLSHYIMDDEDILCMEVKLLCSQHKDILNGIPGLCEMHCSAFDNLIKEEISKKTKMSATRTGNTNSSILPICTANRRPNRRMNRRKFRIAFNKYCRCNLKVNATWYCNKQCKDLPQCVPRCAQAQIGFCTTIKYTSLTLL